MKKQICSAFLAAALTASLAGSFSQKSGDASAANTGMRDMTTMEIVNDMGLGINLGNTFESCGDWIAQWGDGTPNAYETAWGSPTVSEALIKGYADEGFDSLRIPVAWSNMMENDGNYKISDKYMARVEQVVNWALDADLYVIINLHWDGGWLEKLPHDHDEIMKKYRSIWTQVCDEFKDYGDRLIFESQNEELGWNDVWNQWSGSDNGKAESFGYANEVNQVFVDIVRNSGGNNPQRHLLISGYNTAINHTCDPLFKMPDDPAGRCAVSVHYYTPSTFAILEEDADWGKSAYTWGNDAEYAELNSEMNALKTTFVDKGIPVIIGEYGCTKTNKDPESVRRYLTSVAEAALSRGGICPVMWDITDLHYDRSSFKMTDSVVHDALMEIKDKYVQKSETPTEQTTTETTTTTTETTTTTTEPPTVTEPPAPMMGDVNHDGSVGIADIVTMQQFLLGNGTLADWKAGDLYEDGVIDVFDLVRLRKLVISLL